MLKKCGFTQYLFYFCLLIRSCLGFGTIVSDLGRGKYSRNNSCIRYIQAITDNISKNHIHNFNEEEDSNILGGLCTANQRPCPAVMAGGGR